MSGLLNREDRAKRIHEEGKQFALKKKVESYRQPEKK